jgi:hypothetical protein
MERELKKIVIKTQKEFEEYFFGNGKENVKLPKNVLFEIYSNPEDGEIIYDAHNNPLYNGVKCYKLKNSVTFSSNCLLIGISKKDNEFVVIERDNSAGEIKHINFNTNFELLKEFCYNQKGSNEINVPNTEGLEIGKHVIYGVSWNKLCKIVDIQGNKIIVDKKISRAYENEILFVLTENIKIKNIIFDGRSGVNNLGGSVVFYYNSFFVLSGCYGLKMDENSVIRNSKSTFSAGGANLFISFHNVLNISDCSSVESAGGASLYQSSYNVFKISKSKCEKFLSDNSYEGAHLISLLSSKNNKLVGNQSVVFSIEEYNLEKYFKINWIYCNKKSSCEITGGTFGIYEEKNLTNYFCFDKINSLNIKGKSWKPENLINIFLQLTKNKKEE